MRNNPSSKLGVLGGLILIAWLCGYSGTATAQPIMPPLPPFASTALVLVPGATISITLDNGPTQPRYLFLARQGETILLNAQRTAGDGVLVLKLSSAAGVQLDEGQSNDLAGDQTQLQFPVTVDGWYWLDATLDPNGGGNSGTFTLQLTGTTPYLMTLAPSPFPLMGTANAHMVDLFTLTSSPTTTNTLTPSVTLTASNTPTITPTKPATATVTITLTASYTVTTVPTKNPTLLTPTPTDGPIARLRGYIDSVNSGDYQSAYGIFLHPASDYNTFADGYSDTRSIEGYFGSFRPYLGNVMRGDVPSLLVGTKNNGQVDTYRGCYFILSVGNSWYAEADYFKLLHSGTPTSSEISEISTFDCSGLRTKAGLG